MVVKLLCLSLLLLLSCPSRAKKPQCLRSASTCDECIQSGPECAWCTAPYADVRCHTLHELQRAGCQKSYIYNPQGEVQVVRNESSRQLLNQTAFLQPQEFSLRLRPGVSQSFTITMSSDQPITGLTMDTSPLPEGVNITFSSIANGNPLVLQVTVEAAQCASQSDDLRQNRTGPWSVHITPRGFSQSVKLEITLECQCACKRDREENSIHCSEHGALVCGQCECYTPHVGELCQYDSTNEDPCRSGPNAPVCSGRGACVMESCECALRENPNERYTGQFCQCSNFDCPSFRSRLCAGHGKCECGRCHCDGNWTGEDCRCNIEPCKTINQTLCNGRGSCQCGICRCQLPFTGPTCEDCPACESFCQRHFDCVECRLVGTGKKKNRCNQECGHLTMTMVKTKDDLPQSGSLCKMRTEDDCHLYYGSTTETSVGQIIVAETLECPRN